MGFVMKVLFSFHFTNQYAMYSRKAMTIITPRVINIVLLLF
jgi:hypothetical protein